MKKRLGKSARACLENGRRLLDDAEFLEFQDPPTTAQYLTWIAREEFAKGFLLALVVRDVIPWDQRLLRAARDHSCKQLLCLVMDYLSPGTDEFLQRCDAVVLRHEIPVLPPRVADAVDILRHEKLGRWTDRSWVWADDPDYDPDYDREVLAVAEGRRDRLKQDALYVRLARDGGVASIPQGICHEVVRKERADATRMAGLVDGMLDGNDHPGLDYDKVEGLFRALFRSLNEDVRDA